MELNLVHTGGVNSGSYHSGPNPENGMTGQGYNRSRCLKWSAKTLTSDEGKSQKNLPKIFFFLTNENPKKRLKQTADCRKGKIPDLSQADTSQYQVHKIQPITKHHVLLLDFAITTQKPIEICQVSCKNQSHLSTCKQ